mmetsp:Transcript_18644/g.38231  ORF Transcript_18644/g.38231 Transcript_18644/m.38231 type:complete len:132 (+) Transcript_18644:2353-2748(+)
MWDPIYGEQSGCGIENEKASFVSLPLKLSLDHQEYHGECTSTRCYISDLHSFPLSKSIRSKQSRDRLPFVDDLFCGLEGLFLTDFRFATIWWSSSATESFSSEDPCSFFDLTDSRYFVTTLTASSTLFSFP